MLGYSLLIISLTLFALLGATPARDAAGGIAWQGWSEAALQGSVPARMIMLEHILRDPSSSTYRNSLFDQFW